MSRVDPTCEVHGIRGWCLQCSRAEGRAQLDALRRHRMGANALALFGIVCTAVGVGCWVFQNPSGPSVAPCPEGTETGAGNGCYPIGERRFGLSPPPYDSGPEPDGGQCHRQCRAILPGGSASDAGAYSLRCGPCEYFCTEIINGNPVIVALPYPPGDAGCGGGP